MIRCLCSECGSSIVKSKTDFVRGKFHFCSHHCRAIYYNHKRRTLFPRHCLRSGCPNFVTALDRNKKYCSQLCANRDRISRYDASTILTGIREFVLKQGRIPIKSELTTLYRVARNYFGTWNNAVSAAGYMPNPVMFANKHIARDGHQCDSLAEKIVDDWLSARKIHHNIHVPYPWHNGMKCDFWVDGTWIEVFGLSGHNDKYDALKKKKLILVRQYKLKLISLSLKDVYRDGLEQKLIKLSERRHRPS